MGLTETAVAYGVDSRGRSYPSCPREADHPSGPSKPSVSRSGLAVRAGSITPIIDTTVVVLTPGVVVPSISLGGAVIHLPTRTVVCLPCPLPIPSDPRGYIASILVRGLAPYHREVPPDRCSFTRALEISPDGLTSTRADRVDSRLAAYLLIVIEAKIRLLDIGADTAHRPSYDAPLAPAATKTFLRPCPSSGPPGRAA